MPLPPPGDLPEPGIEHMPPSSTGGFFTTEPLESPSLLNRQQYTPVGALSASLCPKPALTCAQLFYTPWLQASASQNDFAGSRVCSDHTKEGPEISKH